MKLATDERGISLVMTALSITVLLLISALALDFGVAHIARAAVQSAVDAASLAGAKEAVVVVEKDARGVEYERTVYIPDRSSAEAKANDVLDAVLGPLSSMGVTVTSRSVEVGERTVQVTVSAKLKTKLLGVVGMRELDLARIGAAEAFEP